MLLGGSRSGKTFVLCRTILVRAVKEAGSRHAILRYRFNAVKQSVWYDTFPKVMDLCFPGLRQRCKFNKSDWFITLPNGSEVWFGGLDEKERTEKILGLEFATIFINECSQVSLSSFELVKTRLAQSTKLKLKFYLDQNPPLKTHWTHRLFVEKRQAVRPFKSLTDPENYTHLFMNPAHNEANIPPEYLKILQNLSARQKQRFWEGQFGSGDENALWTYEVIEQHRVASAPDLQRVVVAVDPSGTKGVDEEKRSDEVGILVVGLGLDGHAYILEDITCSAPPAVWGRAVCMAYERHEADHVVGETNYGGAMVERVIKAAAADLEMHIPYREVHATRGKVVRAEPVSTLYEEGKVHHVGVHNELEDQLCSFTTYGYMGDGSPDHADAAIWGVTDIFPGIVRKKAPTVTQIENVSSWNAYAR
jgi:phage terminase large subunit-like protein